MSLSVVWSMRAEDQLDEHVGDLQQRTTTDAARRLVLRVFDRLDAVADLPQSAPRWHAVEDAAFRRLVVDDFILIYRIDLEAGQIQVLSMRHGRQRPPAVDEVGDP